MVKNTNFNILKDIIIESIKEKQGNNIISINLESLDNSFADMFIITDAQTNKQVEAISSYVQRQVRKALKESAFGIEGEGDYSWVILDYIDIVVHVFMTERRDYYKIEALWGDGIIEKH